MNYPKVSCICVTYGRTELLDEMVQSYLQQDYPGEKELIILNDLDALELKADIPTVKVVNEKKRYPSLGDKRNAAIKMATGDIISIWDDDDISLSHRITSIIKRMGIKPFVIPNNHILLGDENKFYPFACRAQAFFYKSVWKEVGGYPSLDKGEDWKFEHAIRAKGYFRVIDIPPQETAYIYKWNNTGSYHISSYDTKDSFQGPADFTARTLKVSSYEIKPEWRQDYYQITADLVNSHL